MSGPFLPDYGSMPWKGRYRPLYKLFLGDRWKFARKDGQPVECATGPEAIAEAKACVQRILNPEIRAQKADAVADALGVEKWRQQQAANRVAEQEAALGGIIVKGRQVPVERRAIR